MDEPVDSWFKREILIHEAALLRYLNRCWPHREDIQDLRQDIYIRLYEAAAVSRPLNPRAFLFATARHLMTDRRRRSKIISIQAVSDFDGLNVLRDELSPERKVDARQQLKRLARAMMGLPRKCHEVVWLRRIEGLSQKEVAERLKVSERTVESHIQKGMRLLADATLKAPEDAGGTGDHDESGSHHG